MFIILVDPWEMSGLGSDDATSIAEKSAVAVSLNEIVVQTDNNGSAENGRIRANDQYFAGDEDYNLQYRNPSDRPVHKLSVRLIDTYKYINKVWFELEVELFP